MSGDTFEYDAGAAREWMLAVDRDDDSTCGAVVDDFFRSRLLAQQRIRALLDEIADDLGRQAPPA